MVALQVRDFPPELYEELRACAQREHRSIAQQTIVAVQYYLVHQNERIESAQRTPAHIDRIERRKRIFERIDALPTFKDPEGFPTPEQIVREMRDSR